MKLTPVEVIGNQLKIWHCTCRDVKMNFANALTGPSDGQNSCGTLSFQVISSNQGEVNKVKHVVGIYAIHAEHQPTHHSHL